MNRRGFLSLFGLGIAGIALEQAVPLGRVWSFPSEIVLPDSVLIEELSALQPMVGEILTTEFISLKTLEMLKNNLQFTEAFSTNWEKDFGREFPIGEIIPMRFQQVNEVIDRWNSDSTAADPHLSALITS